MYPDPTFGVGIFIACFSTSHAKQDVVGISARNAAAKA
jgi:hypothetical protein